MAVAARLPMVKRLAVAFHEAGNFAADRLVAAARQGDDDRETYWQEEMRRCDDQADVLEALIRKGWI